jgi:hypothetical protein
MNWPFAHGIPWGGSWEFTWNSSSFLEVGWPPSLVKHQSLIGYSEQRTPRSEYRRFVLVHISPQCSRNHHILPYDLVYNSRSLSHPLVISWFSCCQLTQADPTTPNRLVASASTEARKASATGTWWPIISHLLLRYIISYSIIYYRYLYICKVSYSIWHSIARLNTIFFGVFFLIFWGVDMVCPKWHCRSVIWKWSKNGEDHLYLL